MHLIVALVFQVNNTPKHNETSTFKQEKTCLQMCMQNRIINEFMHCYENGDGSVLQMTIDSLMRKFKVDFLCVTLKRIGSHH